MRILLLADIHANWPALAAIDERFDACLFLGDVVDYAADPIPCIDWVRQHALAVVRGNHDHSVAQRVSMKPAGSFRKLAAAMRPRHFEVLNDEHLTWLARMPVMHRIELDGLRFLMIHATPRDPMDEYLEPDPDLWNQRLEHIDADYVCVGHTHIPMHLRLERMQVVNPGSVGQPRDGDPRAAYAVIENGHVEFRRVPYNIDRTIQQMRDAGIDEDAVAIADSVLRRGGTPAGRS